MEPAAAAGEGMVEQRRFPAGARHARILELLARNGFVAVADAAMRLAVSEMTIRRDLWALEDRGLLVRTHGGAMGAGEREIFDGSEPTFSSRRRRNAARKVAIARRAAALIGDREAIGIDVGTSTLALAEEIASRRDIVVFTSSLHAAAVLGRNHCPVHVLGGTVRGPELSVVGADVMKQLPDYYLTRLFLGVSGATADGFFDYSPEDTEIKRAFIARAEQVIVLCDSSKFDHRSLVKVCGLAEVATLVTDAPPPDHIAEALRRAGTAVLVAGSTAGGSAG
jgi:DeoR family glycerol-3-phosphate regulon repressor